MENSPDTRLYIVCKEGSSELKKEIRVTRDKDTLGQLKEKIINAYNIGENGAELRLTVRTPGITRRIDQFRSGCTIKDLRLSTDSEIQVEIVSTISQNKPRNESIDSSQYNSTSPRTIEHQSRYAKYPDGICGLQNIGNTCFMNSAIQCLSSVGILTKYFKNGLYNEDLNLSNPLGTRGEVVKAYAQLIDHLWSGNSQSFEPKDLKRQVARYAPRFSDFCQQDSHEFMTFLLDALHEDLKRSDHSSIITRLFRGEMETQVQCTNARCRTIQTTKNFFMFLPLPICRERDRSISIISCLRGFASEETLGKNGQWLCHICEQKTDAIKKTKIIRLPTVLIIQLKRFDFSRTNEKVEVPVECPIKNFDLSSFVDNEKYNAKYDLIAVSNHYGYLRAGHYTTNAKNFKDNKWYHFDDHRIRQILNENEIITSDAYVLVYMRQGAGN